MVLCPLPYGDSFSVLIRLQANSNDAQREHGIQYLRDARVYSCTKRLPADSLCALLRSSISLPTRRSTPSTVEKSGGHNSSPTGQNTRNATKMRCMARHGTKGQLCCVALFFSSYIYERQKEFSCFNTKLLASLFFKPWGKQCQQTGRHSTAQRCPRVEVKPPFPRFRHHRPCIPLPSYYQSAW